MDRGVITVGIMQFRTIEGRKGDFLMDKIVSRVQFQDKSLTGGEIADLRLAEKEISGFYLAETMYPPDFRIPKHSHVNASFYLVLQGISTEISCGKTHECKPLV